MVSRMTLVLNEIHLADGLARTVMVAAADRRITRPDGTYYGNYPKLWPIHRFNGAVSFFGLAVFKNHQNRECRLWEWLPTFLLKQSSVSGLGELAHNLRDALQQWIPRSVLERNASGFHICGYNDQFLPEYWFLTNIRQMNGFMPSEIKATYKAPAPIFLEDDARTLGWDGQNLRFKPKASGKLYRNGDFRAHAIAAHLLDTILEELFKFPDFRKPRTPAEYKQYVLFKFKFIASLYKKWAVHQIVGEPIDIRVWSADVDKSRILSH